jgi:hypothetical protein
MAKTIVAPKTKTTRMQASNTIKRRYTKYSAISRFAEFAVCGGDRGSNGW